MIDKICLLILSLKKVFNSPILTFVILLNCFQNVKFYAAKSSNNDCTYSNWL